MKRINSCSRIFTFNKKYFILLLFVFIIELFIALYVRDGFIRPYGGDILAVLFVYYFLKIFLKLDNLLLASFALFFAFLIEIAQYFNVLVFLRLENSNLARIILGNSFSWGDIACYFVGILLILFLLPKKLR